MNSDKSPEPTGPDPPDSQVSDDELFRRYIANRSADTFAEIERRYRQRIYQYCVNQLGNRTDAEDTTQEVFLALLKRAPTLRPGNLHGYLFECARLAVSQILRKRHPAIRLDECIGEPDALLSNYGLPAHGAERNELLQHLWDAVDRMSATYAQALVMHYRYGLDAQEMAERLQISIDAVHHRLSRARHSLCELLAREGLLPPGSTEPGR